MATTILLVGCGNMGFAMLDGWLKSDAGLSAHVVEPLDALRNRAGDIGAATYASAADLPEGFAPELAFIAVKPQVMTDVLPDYAPLAGGSTTFVSVAAGTTIATLAALLPGPTPIVRCMPNTPAAIGAGMMICCANELTPQPVRDLVSQLLAASGLVDWIEDEGLMDAVTALSGSGPAYVFHMVECMAAAGEAVGLDPELALKMARQTVMGAGQLAASSDTPPATLREQVTSPGGTTAAGLSVLMAEPGLAELMRRTVEAARDRGEELGKA